VEKGGQKRKREEINRVTKTARYREQSGKERLTHESMNNDILYTRRRGIMMKKGGVSGGLRLGGKNPRQSFAVSVPHGGCQGKNERSLVNRSCFTEGDKKEEGLHSTKHGF